MRIEDESIGPRSHPQSSILHPQSRREAAQNAASLFADAARRVPARVAFYERGHAVSFGELWNRVAQYRGGLAERGFAPGDRALILLPMSVDLYVALLAVLAHGGVAAFLDPWVGFRQMVRLAVYSEPKAFLARWKGHLLRLASADLRRIPITRVTPGRALHDVHPVGTDERALITFTTGSSGNPKGVNRTHRILRAQHERLAAEWPAREGDVDLCTFPVFALNNLALGVPTVIPPIDFRRVAKANPRKVAEAARRAGVTTATASPPLFDLLAAIDERPRFRRVLTGGAPVTDTQLRRWLEAWPDAEIEVAYGSTEAEPVARISARERLVAAGEKPDGAYGTDGTHGIDGIETGFSHRSPSLMGYIAGHIAQAVRARVIPINHGPVTQIHELPQGEIGELIVTGDHVCRDYDGDPEGVRQNKIHDTDGTVWHRMGDTGWFDEAGRFRIAGRVHSTITRNGTHIHPQLVEQAAIGDDARIRRAAAIGLGERLIVVIESDHDVAADVRARLEAVGGWQLAVGSGETTDGHPGASSTANRQLPTANCVPDSRASSTANRQLPTANSFEILVRREPLPVDPRHNSKIDYTKLKESL
ncbi:MAG TPA: AMP-binding protein [Thermoanaerobaculia bacterium]